MNARKVIARFLLDLADRHGERFDVPMSRRDMADYLGVPVEEVSRVLSRFAKARIIAIPNIHQIEIVDRTALEAIVGTDC